MSELDVDGELLSITDAVEENEHILQSIHACVLSSKKGLQKLDESIQVIRSNQDPELIIIETSGSCHPMPLIQYFEKQKQLKLTAVFALVDCLMLSHDYEYGASLITKMQNNLAQGLRDTVNLLVEQVMFCSHLLLTKVDRIDEEKLTVIVEHVQKINPFASTHAVLFGKLELESLLELDPYNYRRVAQLFKELKPILQSESTGDRPYNLATRVLKDDRPFHPTRLWTICHEYLDQRIYRSKGFFWLASRNKHALLWNQAAGSISLEIIGSWRSGIVEDDDHGVSSMEIDLLKERLAKESGRFGDRHCEITVIGDKTQVDRFTEALQSCFLNDKEIERWKNGYKFEDPWPTKLVKMMD